MRELKSIWFKDFEVEPERWYTVTELQKGLHIGRKVIYEHVKRQNFKAGQLSQELLIEGASIITFLNHSRGGEPKKPKVLPSVLTLCTTHEIVNIANCDSSPYVFQKCKV